MSGPAFLVVAVDGAAASGKSSTSRAVADRLGLLHVDSGAHYRALTLHFLNRGVDPARPAQVEEALAGLLLGTTILGRSAHPTLNGTTPAAEDLRGAAVNALVSPVAACPRVRAFLLDYQRGQVEVARQAGFAGLIMEGRDIGSVILPGADHKFFLEADPSTRARRRAGEGQTDAIAARDRLDSGRATAPLVCPPDAHRLDTTAWPLELVVDRICQIITAPPHA